MPVVARNRPSRSGSPAMKASAVTASAAAASCCCFGSTLPLLGKVMTVTPGLPDLIPYNRWRAKVFDQGQRNPTDGGISPHNRLKCIMFHYFLRLIRELSDKLSFR